FGVELNPDFVHLTEERLALETARTDQRPGAARVILGDARALDELGLPTIDYCLTSPPYWDMLRRPGFETQSRRRQHGLPLTYSELPDDLGNIGDYDSFVDEVCGIYERVWNYLRPGAYLTIVVKNVK